MSSSAAFSTKSSSARRYSLPPAAPAASSEEFEVNDSDPYLLGFSEFDLSPGVKVIPYELRKATEGAECGAWESIKVGSLDWRQTQLLHPRAVVVRVSSIVSHEDPDRVIDRVKTDIAKFPGISAALHIVCMFKEFAVSVASPVRYTANFWFIFPSVDRHSADDFELSISAVLPAGCISYITMEMLGSFLSRREYESKEITFSEALSRLENFLRNSEPCSSLFLKLSPECPEVCRNLLLEIKSGESKKLVGVRAIHKLAVSCTSAHMSSRHNYNETLSVMKIGCDSKEWSFVVFKTLTRLATKNDRSAKINPLKDEAASHVVEMLKLVDSSNLQFVEKLAIRLIAKDYRCPPCADARTDKLVEFLYAIITSSTDFISDADFASLCEIINEGSPATCHLTGVLLEKCVEQENFNIGWKIASTVLSVNEHTIEEVVTLCSKAFFKFSRTDKAEANLWFDRVHWCIERHYKLLGKYPSGLALHVAAHRGDFELCWKWFTAKKEEKSFRFTAHHTSSIFKAATYSATPCSHMSEVVQAYKMTPHKEKSSFVFEPLFHLWQITESIREESFSFWEMVHKDLSSYLGSFRATDDNSMRKVKKLSLWETALNDWKKGKTPVAASSSKKNRRAHSFAGPIPTPKDSGVSASSPSAAETKRVFSRKLSDPSIGSDSKSWRRSELASPILEETSSITPSVPAVPHHTRRASAVPFSSRGSDLSRVLRSYGSGEKYITPRRIIDDGPEPGIGQLDQKFDPIFKPSSDRFAPEAIGSAKPFRFAKHLSSSGSGSALSASSSSCSSPSFLASSSLGASFLSTSTSSEAVQVGSVDSPSFRVGLDIDSLWKCTPSPSHATTSLADKDSEFAEDSQKFDRFVSIPVRLHLDR